MSHRVPKSLQQNWISIFVENNLDQDVTIQLAGNWKEETDGVDIGSAFTVPARGKDFKSLSVETCGWLPYIYCKAKCNTAPTSGALTVLRIRSKDDVAKLFDAYEIRDTEEHVSEVVEW